MNVTDLSSQFSESAAEILVQGDARLQVQCLPLDAFDRDARANASRLAATLAQFHARHGYGRAIAAPQIGWHRRAIAMDLGAGPLLLLNPEITWRSDETFELWDDCFSVPDQLVRVRRHCSINLRYRDAQWRPRTWERLPRDLAELLQHEIDHLDGVLMTARAVGADAIRPAAQRGELVDAARATHRLSLVRIRTAAREIDPVFLNSPQFDCEPLSGLLGCRLTLKVETLNPVRCFKGRGADRLVAERIARGDTGALVCASAGNFGQALAYACRKHGIALTVFAARNANALKVARMRALGADVHSEGEDFDAAKDAARAFALASGATMIEDGLEATISEGAGSIAVELLAQDAAYDAVLVPLGNGALLNGMARWLKAASPATRVLGVCSSGAPAMAQSWQRGPGAATVISPRVETIADGIAVRVPIAEAVADMHGLVDDVLLVDDRDVLAAMRLLHEHAGLLVEPAGAVGLAALLAQRERFAGLSVATVLCGSNLTPEQMRQWLVAGTGVPAADRA